MTLVPLTFTYPRRVSWGCSVYSPALPFIPRLSLELLSPPCLLPQMEADIKLCEELLAMDSFSKAKGLLSRHIVHCDRRNEHACEPAGDSARLD